MTRTSRTVRTYRYVGPDGRELKRVETTTKTIHDDGTEKTEVQVTEDPGFPPEARPPGGLAPGCPPQPSIYPSSASKVEGCPSPRYSAAGDINGRSTQNYPVAPAAAAESYPSAASQRSRFASAQRSASAYSRGYPSAADGMNSSGFKLSSASGQPLLSFGQRSSSAYSRGYPSAADQIDSSATGQARPILTTSSQCPAGGKQPQKQSSMVSSIGNSAAGDDMSKTNRIPPPRPLPAKKKGAVSGWGQKESAVKPSIAVQGKSYQDIKQKCLEQGALWEDDEFPAVDSSIFYSRRPAKKFEWKRPGEICEKPQLFVEGASRFDVQQGELGDCWLLAAVASLTCNKKLLHRVVPQDQSFTKDYAGIFHFQFWQYGEWVDVVVDDRLPTYYGRLVFLHSAENNEFWSALLEKAYAKLVGSYEALKGGSQAEAMEDFTGGLTERFDLNKAPKNLLTIMLKGADRGSLMGCALDANGEIEGKGPLGLITGHAYSVTGVKMVAIKTARADGSIPLVRVRNPWGNEAEWQGPWSDKSREWSLISAEEKKDMGLTFDDDGEFWMSFTDFCKYFTTLEMCSLGPDSMSAEGGENANMWSAKQHTGRWAKRVNAGGCRNFLDTFWTNPQYRVSVTDPDDDDDDNLCTVVLGLMQKDRRKKREQGLDMLTIGYCIYKLKEEVDGNLDLNFFKYNASHAKSPTFINTREVCGRHMLEPGTYVVVPSTFSPNEEADFVLRVFSEKAAEADSVDEDTGYDDSSRKARAPPIDSAVVDKLRDTFTKISGDDMEIDAYELRDILNAAYKQEFDFDEFSIETARSMVALFDYDHSGKLGFDEFCELWNLIREWKGIFKKYDADKSGSFNSYELRQACKSAGYRLSNGVFTCIVMRFANRAGFIEFDDFILCLTRLKALNDTFSDAGTGRKATFGLDEFIQNGIYS